MIADEIFSKLSPVDGLQEHFRSLYRDCVKVSVNNVSDYYYMNPKEQWSPDDFPCVAPPWRIYWMEWRTSSVMYSDHPSPIILQRERWEKQENGVYKIFVPPESRAVMTLTLEEPWAAEFAGAKWVFLCRFFSTGIPGAYVFNHTFFVTAQGQLLMIPSTMEMHKLLRKYLPMYKWSEDLSTPDPAQFIIPHQWSTWMTQAGRKIGFGYPGFLDQSVYDVMWLALSFCNCKNIAVRKDRIDEKLRANRERKNRMPHDAMHTIEIEPIKRMLRTAAAGHTSLQEQLKFHRGHFKHFNRPGDRKLFGKHTGVWFWPPKLKEDTSYNINPPKGDKS